MKNLLQQHFPLIRTREEIFNEIQCSPTLRTIFYSWKDNKNREEFLDICSGAKGVKMLYDSFFKTILNPETVPSRLNWLLSLLLGTDVEVLEVLPQDFSSPLTFLNRNVTIMVLKTIWTHG